MSRHAEEVRWMVRGTLNRKGQSIVEYLVVAAAIVLAIIAVRGTMQSSATNLMNNSAAKLNVSF